MLKILSISTGAPWPKKYRIVIKFGKTIATIDFGDQRYQQYHDKFGHYRNLDHLDPIRRKRYLTRARGIRDGDGNLTVNNPFSANYWSTRILW